MSSPPSPAPGAPPSPVPGAPAPGAPPSPAPSICCAPLIKDNFRTYHFVLSCREGVLFHRCFFYRVHKNTRMYESIFGMSFIERLSSFSSNFPRIVFREYYRLVLCSVERLSSFRCDLLLV